MGTGWLLTDGKECGVLSGNDMLLKISEDGGFYAAKMWLK